ncbi:MAG: hypothetical protein MPK62_10935, partial [Alphaproteobacteria bacterium]|nr:hypothetical protein [Alphaproteobacteria bacterium]
DKLTGEEKAMLREKFEEEGILNIIRDATHPLAALYANYPLKFLGPSETASSKNDLVLAVKKCVGRVRNSHGPESAILRAFSLLFLLCAGRYKIFQGLEKPDIDSIIHDPSSEAAERAMSRIRGETLIFFQMSNVDPSWAKHFWNRNFELSPCEFESSSEERPR